jgi:CheY-like chemotaxis protein
LAEDNSNDRQIFRVALKRADGLLLLVEVEDGEEAIAYLSGEGKFGDRTAFPLPNLIVLDAKMPKIDAIGVLEWLRARLEFADVPRMVWSGTQRPGQEQAVRSLGAEYFTKSQDFAGAVRFACTLLEKRLGPPGTTLVKDAVRICSERPPSKRLVLLPSRSE